MIQTNLDFIRAAEEFVPKNFKICVEIESTRAVNGYVLTDYTISVKEQGREWIQELPTPWLVI